MKLLPFAPVESEASSDAERMAQLALEGRSHYFDASSLGFFASRVVHAQTAHGGLVFAAIESRPVGSWLESSRRYCYRVFNVLGEPIPCPSAERGWKQLSECRRHLAGFLAGLDAVRETNDCIRRGAARHGKELAKLATAVAEYEASLVPAE